MTQKNCFLSVFIRNNELTQRELLYLQTKPYLPQQQVLLLKLLRIQVWPRDLEFFRRFHPFPAGTSYDQVA